MCGGAGGKSRIQHISRVDIQSRKTTLGHDTHPAWPSDDAGSIHFPRKERLRLPASKQMTNYLFTGNGTCAGGYNISERIIFTPMGSSKSGVTALTLFKIIVCRRYLKEYLSLGVIRLDNFLW